MIFGEAKVSNMENEKQILNIYSSWLGQVNNYFKSSILFTNNLSTSVKNELSGILGIQ